MNKIAKHISLLRNSIFTKVDFDQQRIYMQLNNVNLVLCNLCTSRTEVAIGKLSHGQVKNLVHLQNNIYHGTKQILRQIKEFFF